MYLWSYFLRERLILEKKKYYARMKILPFAAQFHPALSNLKNIQMGR